MNRFTPKEMAIIEMLLEGHPVKTIAEKQECAIATVHAHLRNIRMKTKTHSISEIIYWVVRKNREN